MNIREILHQTTLDFVRAGLETPRLDAEVLLTHALNTDRCGLYRSPERQLSEAELHDFRRLAIRRYQGEPVAYITGEKEFWSLSFAVSNQVLVPRPETEVLVEEVLAVCRDKKGDGFRILEIGTGSGAISVALASELENALFWATDISEGALGMAKRNAERHAVADRIRFSTGDMFAPVSGRFHIIVSNPPYIPDDEFDSLPHEIRRFEPKAALSGGREGIEMHRDLVRLGYEYLEESGWLFFEIGSGQRRRIEDLLRADLRYDEIGFRRDYGGMERVVKARKKVANG